MTHPTDAAIAQASEQDETVTVPAWFLRQVFGMAREGCNNPAAAYRWCERIDAMFFTPDNAHEYAEFELALPAPITPPAQAAEAVERVAEALANDARSYTAQGWVGLFEEERQIYRRMARAAIAAMQAGEAGK